MLLVLIYKSIQNANKIKFSLKKQVIEIKIYLKPMFELVEEKHTSLLEIRWKH